MLKIVLGNKSYSSWSFRPWLALKHTGAPFEEVVIGLDLPDTAQQIAKYSRAGRVPILIDGELTIWDSIAICEYLAEKFPGAKLWPEDRAARAVARSAAAEMHSGFVALRTHHTMKVKEQFPPAPLREDVQADVARIAELWTECRKRYGAGGPFLFGHFTIADAMYGPVVSRFRTYQIPLPPKAQEYAEAMWKDPAYQEWVAGAKAEKLRARRYE